MKNECENLSLYFYGELDARAAAAFEAHLKACPRCQKDLAFLGRMQQALVPPAAAQNAVEKVLAPRRAAAFWRRVLKPALGTALVVGLGVLLFVSGPKAHYFSDEGEDLMAYISAEADAEYQSFAADLEAFENEF